MKYIIDVPDEAVSFMDGEMDFFVEPKIRDERRRHYVLRIDHKDVSIYTEPDRKTIENEVWENTWKMFLTQEDFGATMGDSYSEAKAKYEAWKKSKEEIRVGDEVEQITASGNPVGLKCVVTKIVDDEILKGITQTGEVVTCSSQVKRWWHKTGRHFSEVEELLKKLGGEQE